MATQHASAQTSPQTSIGDGLQKYSCVLCSSRKVKCDRHDPCSGCHKAQVPCVFRAPAPPRRGKRKSPEELHQARLKRFEEVRKASEPQRNESRCTSASTDDNGAGVSKEAGVNSTGMGHSPTSPHTGKLVVEGVRSRYIENGLWKVLSDQTIKDGFQGFPDETDDRSEEVSTIDSISNDTGLVLGSSSIGINLTPWHPQPVHIFKLWQLFLDNVDPVAKVVHAPTVQKQILEASGSSESISKPLEVMMFAIYTLAVTSLSEVECEITFQENKHSLLGKYQKACRQALINARFLQTSDLMVLQAYVLFLLSLRGQAEPESLWSLSGISVRIAQRMGLHRDGTSLGLPPFQVEMRRRLWWQITVLDEQTAQLTGSGSSLLFRYSTTKFPLNINDSDLYLDMNHIPAEHNGPTQMSFSLLRYDICEYLQRMHNEKPTAAERDRSVDEMEKRFDQHYIRNHDRSIPIHFLTMHVAALAICKMRWLGAEPSQWQAGDHSDRGESLYDSDTLFSTSLKLLDCELRLRSDPVIQRFRWHSKNQAQWQTFIFVLSELRRRCDSPKLDDDISRAWSLIEEFIECQPDVINDHRKALHVAVCNVTLAAWKSYEIASDSRHLQVPSFIRMLREKIAVKKHEWRFRGEPVAVNKRLSELSEHRTPQIMDGMDQYSEQNYNPEQQTWQSNQGYDSHSFYQTPPFDYQSVALNPVDWSEWDGLMQEMDLGGPGIGGSFFLT